jgi:hypothetical protein
MRVLILGGLALLAACDGAGEAPGPIEAGITISGHFGDYGEASEDMSGLACDWQGRDPPMRCLAIEDEGADAQWVSFDGSILSAGPRFALDTVGTPLGTAPRDLCTETDLDDRELDGEAAAFSDGVFYVTGSHGCSRNSDELRPSGFIVARIAPDEPGMDVSPGTVAITQSRRLAGLMQHEPQLADYFGASLQEANGLNVEGLAVQGDRMVFGLRAPVIDGEAFLFETSVTALFSREIVGPGQAVPVPLGDHAGVRDLAFLPDGRLLILSGPAQEQDVPYRIHLRDGDGTVSTLATVDAPGDAKAEAMAIVGMEGGTVSLLILFDSAEDGAPQSLDIDLRG